MFYFFPRKCSSPGQAIQATTSSSHLLPRSLHRPPSGSHGSHNGSHNGASEEDENDEDDPGLDVVGGINFTKGEQQLSIFMSF